MLKILALSCAMFLSSLTALADYRPNHGGYGHNHDCEGSDDEKCEPHHHTLDDFGIKIAVDEMIHVALMEYNRRTELRKKLGRENYWSMRKSLVDAFIEYFKENRKELLAAIPSNLGNAPGYCFFLPANNKESLTHSEDECRAFKEAKPLPPTDPNKERVSRPIIEDFIRKYLKDLHIDKI